jgi:nucleoside-diphosphate-sugar epimerase
VDENSAVRPISLYGQTKVDSEKVLLAAASRKFHPTVVRLATVFGNSYRPRFDLVVNLLTAKAFQEGTITIFNGQQWRPFVHVRDVAAGILRVLDAPLELVSGEIFNLGDSRINHTLSGIAGLISRAFPDTDVCQVDNDDRRNYRVSFEKIRTRLGFRCEKTVEDGIAELKLAFETGQITDYTNVFYHNQRYLQASGTPGNEAPVDSHVMAAFALALREDAAANLQPVSR